MSGLPDPLFTDDISRLFRERGWRKQSAEYFFDGKGGSSYPHLHMHISQTNEFQSYSVRSGGDVRGAIKMVAWSDGGQGRGGGGQTVWRNFVLIDQNWRELRSRMANPDMLKEYNWIMSYLAEG